MPRDALDRRLMVRLVKGAYWDTEVKRAQERGLADYPVFTRKAMTDLSYMACVRQLLAARPRLYPQFATHNALTVASVIEEAGGVDGYEFQRLHGMGEVLYEALLAELPGAACRVYAPVGSHRDLLAYLVRRLLENGANSSFVAVAADPNVPIEAILKRPQAWIGDAAHARHPHIPLPRDLYRPARRNSAGVEFGDRAALDALLAEVARAAPATAQAAPLIDGVARPGASRRGALADRRRRRRAGDRSRRRDRDAGDGGGRRPAFRRGMPTPVERRAEILERAAELLEAARGRLIALLQAEGGKTLDDALVRSARGGRLLPLLRRRGAPRAGAAADAGADRRVATSCAIAAAASSSASARGISRWRSSSARSPRRSPPAMPWWRSPPSRRR